MLFKSSSASRSPIVIFASIVPSCRTPFLVRPFPIIYVFSTLSKTPAASSSNLIIASAEGRSQNEAQEYNNCTTLCVCNIAYFVEKQKHKILQIKKKIWLGMRELNGFKNTKLGRSRCNKLFTSYHPIANLVPEAHGPQRSPECTAMKAIFSQSTVNVACKKK